MFFAPSRKLAAHRLKNGGPRIYDPRERLATGLFDGMLRLASPFVGLRPDRAATSAAAPRPGDADRILALRLDRLGDLLTTLPALRALRSLAPAAHIELGVGSWNEPIASRLPFVDAVRVVDAPWAAWGKKARFSDARRALSGEWDLALDFQGDVRVNLLMSLARARLRAGYGETGGAYLLTHRASWDESRSWYWQNMELVRSLFPGATVDEPARPYNFLKEEDRKEAAGLVSAYRRPLIGIHPSAGRALKQWEEEKFAALADRLADGKTGTGSGTVIFTGAPSDRPLVESIQSKTRGSHPSRIGLPLVSFAALVERLDVFVTGDTGPMHLSHAVGTPNVAIFGPSDPVRYGPPDGVSVRRVVRHPLFCSPCNMIRRPPRECLAAAAPDCIAGIGLEPVLEAVISCLNVRS